MLQLKDGYNKIEYTVKSELQGEQSISGSIFLYEQNVKIVVSDIDGTVTRSDIRGNVYYVFGKEWFQPEICDLYTKIEQNGYVVMYLSARPIGMHNVTTTMITGLKQGEE